MIVVLILFYSIETLLTSVFDRMTQLIYFGNNVPQYNDLFAHHSPNL